MERNSAIEKLIERTNNVESDMNSSFPFSDLHSNYQYADYSYEIIKDRIEEFEKSLDDEHEVLIQLASFGQSIKLAVTDIGYSNPSTLVFYGYIGEQSAMLIQHVSQLNFLLLSAKKKDPEKPARRIGFATPSEDPDRPLQPQS
ncbi:MAG: DUF6173 family protein [Oscillospiraceae bacterium]|jgi:hypothetical protein